MSELLFHLCCSSLVYTFGKKTFRNLYKQKRRKGRSLFDSLFGLKHSGQIHKLHFQRRKNVLDCFVVDFTKNYARTSPFFCILNENGRHPGLDFVDIYLSLHEDGSFVVICHFDLHIQGGL